MEPAQSTSSRGDAHADVTAESADESAAAPAEAEASLGTVARVARILRCFAEGSGDVTIKGVADTVGLPPSTVHRLLHLLMQERFVERAPSQGYRAGTELLRVAVEIAARADIGAIALPVMREVVAACGEACVLIRYLPESREVMTIATVNSPHPLRYAIELFRPRTALWGATGRAALAFQPQPEIEAAYDAGVPSPADGRPLPPRAQLMAELAAIQRAGFASSMSQTIPGAVGIGVPLKLRSGRVAGALCVTIPKQRFRRGSEREIAAVLRARAEELGALIGDAAWDATSGA
jgi:DNA-binding IclR family transcriptional regulator